MNGNWWVEIVFLAMLAGFIALRLVSVLGRRTGHEPSASDAYTGGGPEFSQPGGKVIDLPSRQPVDLPQDLEPETKAGLAAIAEADASFDPARFVEGAKLAYRMILEAYWRGDIDEVEPFMSDEVADQFRASIAERGTGAIPNRIQSIEGAKIVGASLDGMMAEIAVRFSAAIAGGVPATRQAANDEWIFRRHVAARDPNWLLVATDADEE